MASNGMSSPTSTFIYALHRSKPIALASWVGYWLLYAYSNCMVTYYRFDVTQFLREYNLTNLIYVHDYRNFIDAYYSGIIWYVTPHLELTLLYGPVIFSVILSTLFSLNMAMLRISLGRALRRNVLPGGLGIIPILFGGGCCSVPIGTALLGSLMPLSISIFLADFPYLTNLFMSAIMLTSLLFLWQRIKSLMPEEDGKFA